MFAEENDLSVVIGVVSGIAFLILLIVVLAAVVLFCVRRARKGELM
jgi:cbb3-type cytochrome oxidase subunit 3